MYVCAYKIVYLLYKNKNNTNIIPPLKIKNRISSIYFLLPWHTAVRQLLINLVCFVTDPLGSLCTTKIDPQSPALSIDASAYTLYSTVFLVPW